MSKGTVTISGAPVKLQELVSEAEFFRLSKSLEIPVDGLYHAALLYGDAHINEIMGLWEDHGETWSPPRVVISTGTGQPLIASHPDLLLQKAVEEILKQPLNWDSCLDGMLSHVHQSAARECIVYSLGTDHTSRGLVAKLRIRY